MCLFFISRSVLVFSASWHRGKLLFGHLFFGAKNSESCLTEFRSKFNVRIFGSNSKLDFVLCFFTLKAQVQFS
ncbi:hypothetical protein DMJ37_23885 [Vibrio parahaemolyticus]|nr:hypothetical protein D0871_07355 [Vibrio parahaemolyticus]EGQ9446009.1 hypothetical protein [Vibrio parahaemolyticus]EGR3370854.1 hypothetical protein [Vibrio parahaemolyticus]OXD01997.1 hypothetical protein CA166_23920 [Vibrio parahaemolyticus]TOE89396.1 hypothetical protein CGJ32_22335 [Vibrio parahaemolyticus]